MRIACSSRWARLYSHFVVACFWAHAGHGYHCVYHRMRISVDPVFAFFLGATLEGPPYGGAASPAARAARRARLGDPSAGEAAKVDAMSGSGVRESRGEVRFAGRAEVPLCLI
eukprot:3171713-Pyramimonas_sp.AAC.1